MSGPVHCLAPKLVALVLASLAALSGCSSLGGSPAATVNGSDISVEALDDEIRAIESNQAYREQIEAQIGAIAGAGEGTFSATFASRVLTLRVYFELLEQELSERGVEITEADEEAVRDRVVAQTGGQEIFGAFPERYQRLLLRRDALVEASFEAVTADVSPEGAREYFEANQDEFTEVCVRHIFGSFDQRGVEGAEGHIRSLAEQIAGAPDFDRLVGRSDDPGAEDGLIGCGPPDRFGELADEVDELPVGQVSEPVQTSSGWHLVLVTERSVPEFEEVEGIVRERLGQLSDTAFQEFLDEVTCDADVDVNPRFGDWVSNCSAAGTPGLVQAPVGPTTTTVAPGGIPVPGGET